ncbi:HET domain-containing protein [Fusarium sp. LHS14.1]|nr:HET domain-containing protein [Fusarium sp. LHS14.1]
MRLLNTTSLKLEYFVEDETPNYAILSHRWEAEEILFEDVQTEQWPQKKRCYEDQECLSPGSERWFRVHLDRHLLYRQKQQR